MLLRGPYFADTRHQCILQSIGIVLFVYYTDLDLSILPGCELYLIGTPCLPMQYHRDKFLKGHKETIISTSITLTERTIQSRIATITYTRLIVITISMQFTTALIMTVKSAVDKTETRDRNQKYY